MTSPTKHQLRHTAGALVGLSVFIVAGAACGGDDDTVPLSDWVAEFDRICVETVGELSDSAMSDAEFRELSLAAIDEMRAIGDPDEMADTAEELLDAIEASTDGIERTQSEIDELDRRVLVRMTSLGVSDECIGGPSG